MPRSLTPRGVRALQAQTENAALLSLVTITHAPSGSLFRVVDNSVPITSRSIIFYPWSFRFVLAQDSLTQQPQVEFEIDNVDLVLVDMLRAANSPPAIKIELVVSDAPNVVEMLIDGLLLRNVRWNVGTITGTLLADDIFTQSFPSRHPFFDPMQNPGLFT
jgi:hypothetical protein